MNFSDWFIAQEKRIKKDFMDFLRFRSISTDPDCAEECRNTAEWLCKKLQSMGMEATLLESSGQPVVFGEYKKQGGTGPSILLYQHYDVQPVDPIELWDSDPFEPVWKEDNTVFARGASDNKGQCFMTLSAVEAFLFLAKEKDLHIKIFIEGEEESGSAGTLEVIDKYRDRLRADYLCVLDFELFSRDEPAISLGYRGLIAGEITCTNAATDLHSGGHGGIALNPLRIMSEALAKLWDEKGRVTLPGFYDAVDPFVEEERKGIDFSFDEELYRKEFGVGALCQEFGFTPKEQGTLRPTLEINGLWGGYIGVGFKTVLPAKAQAKLSCRLVSGQDPKTIQKSLDVFLQHSIPIGAQLKIKWLKGAKSFRVSSQTMLVKTVASSLEEVFKRPCRYTLSGGSIPIIRDLVEAVQGEVALFGFALDTDNIHAPNEHFHWDCFKKGFLVMTQVLQKLAK